jgi:hypothetical protein
MYCQYRVRLIRWTRVAGFGRWIIAYPNIYYGNAVLSSTETNIYQELVFARD